MHFRFIPTKCPINLNDKMSKVFPRRKIIRLKEVDSTNIYASKLPENTPEGSVVIAEYQSKGRGQGSNKWESTPGENLMCSIVLYPTFLKANMQFYLSKAIALAVADFVSLYTDKVSIKWPNDIYVKDRKIAGILIEHAIERDYIKQTIAGIGININQHQFSQAIPNPISLNMATEERYEIDELLDILISLIENRYVMLKENDFATLDENYLSTLFRYKVKSEYSANGMIFNGTITGVEPTGELKILDEAGQTHNFLNKEVEFIL